jgi:hypothetical protein
MCVLSESDSQEVDRIDKETMAALEHEMFVTFNELRPNHRDAMAAVEKTLRDQLTELLGVED